MECNEVLSRLSAWVDGELDADRCELVDAHLAACSQCHEAADELRALDRGLRRAVVEQRAQSALLANRIIAQIPRPAVGYRTLRQGARLVAAAAAGFLLAVVLFSAKKDPDPQPPAPEITAIPVATLTLATGDVHYRPVQAAVWKTACAGEPLQCANGASVKTGGSTRCELKTAADALVRLDHDTEVQHLSERALEVASGQVWCDSSGKSPVQVKAKRFTASCADGQFVVSCSPKESAVVAVQGVVRVREKNRTHEIKRGQRFSIADGERPRLEQVQDVVLATRWLHSLLMKKGRADRELHQRVDALLAQLGRTKLELLYDREIRRMGDHAVPPLTAFVRSFESRKQPEQRLKAINLVADLATSWSIPDLIGLLADEDAKIRFHAARGLQRLTGLTHGRSPAQWQSDKWTSCAPTHRTWVTWWGRHKSEYSERP